MSTTVKTLIDSVDSLYDNTYTDDNKLQWINDLEAKIYSEVIDKFLASYYALEENKSQYDFPSGVEIEDIIRVYVQGKEYYKLSNAFQGRKGYWNEDNKINLYPIPNTDDTSYEADSGELTFTTSTITGGSFTGFYTGDVVTISGCTDQTANNITARLVQATSDTLTFTSNTFTAQTEEAGEVTIQKNSLKIVYKYKPTTKTIGDITTDTLILPDSFRDMYEYYIYMQIAYFDREIAEHNNHARLFNTRLKDFKDWWNNHRPMNENTDIESRFDYEYDADSCDY